VEVIMKKALFVVLTVMLVSLPANGKVISRSVEYKQDNTVLQGYLAYNDSKTGKRPGVLVVHEWWGLKDYVRSRVNKLAQLGYVAFALDMYGKNVWTTDPIYTGNLYVSHVGNELGLQLKQTPHGFADDMGGRQKFFAGGLDLWLESIDRPPQSPYIES
jgi:Dienelactone hydrolase family